MASDFTKRYLAARRKKEEEGKLPSFSGTARRVEEAAPRSQSTRTEAPAKGQDDFTSRYLARKKELGLVTERNARFTPTLPDFRGRGLTGSTITDSAASSAQSAAKQSTSYLDTARNAGKTTIAATSTLGEDERKKRMDELTGEIEKLNSAIELQQSGISRASVYGGADAMRERLREDQERLKALQDEYTTLERSGEHTEADELRWQIEDAEKRKRELDNTIPAGEAGGRAAAYAWKNNPELQDEYIQQHGEFVEAKSAQESLEALEAAREYVAKVDEKSYEDDFGGQFGANYRLGRINQDMNDAFNRYLINPTEEIKEAAYTLWELANEFQTKYDTVLDDEGAILPWITQDAAGYVPQFVDQAKAELTGGAIGALGGALVGNPIAGFRAGAIAGSGVESYGQMRGAAFRAMIEAGADEEEARAAANDEALINALIEMGGTAISFASLGGTKALNVLADAATKSGSKAAPVLTKLLGKSAVDKAAGVAAKEAGKTAGRKVLYTIGGIGINALGEAAEDAAQQGVSIANRNREGEGIANLVKEASGTLWDAATGKDDAARDEIADAAWQGFKVALMFGGTQSVVNNVASNYLNAKSNKQRDAVVDAVMRDDEVLTALVEEGKASGENSVSAKIASEIESDLSNGKSVTREQVKSLIAANDVYIAEENRVAAQEEAKSAAEKLGYGEHGRATLASISETQELSTEEVNAEFHLPYLQGLSNMDVSETNFTSPLQREAFNAGKLDRIMNTKKDVEKSKFATVYGAESGLVPSAASKTYNQQTVETINKVSKAFGTKTMLEAEIWQKDGKIVPKGTEGAREADAAMRSDGVLMVSLNAGDPIYTLIKHEITHRFQQLAPVEYGNYRDAVMRYTLQRDAESGIKITDTEHHQNELGLDVAKANDEIAAEFTKEILQDEAEFSRFVDSLLDTESNTSEQIAQNRTFLQKFVDTVREFIDKVKRAFGGDKGKMDKAAQKEFGATVDQLERIESLWKEAAKKSAEVVREKSGETKKSAAQTSDAQFYLNPKFISLFDAWYEDRNADNTLKTGGYFHIGTTSEALQSIGIKDYAIYWDKSKIIKILNDHPEMTPDVIKSVPQILEHPIIVMQSKTVVNRVILYSEIAAEGDVPVMVAVELRPHNKRGEIMDFAKVASAYGRKTVQNDIDTSDILYVDANKKRTDTWLEALRLQLPAGITKYGSIGRVTYVDRDVKGNISFGEDSGKTAMQIAMEKAEAEKTASAQRKEAQFSMKDSEGATLTKEQREFFKDSKVRDENGNLMVMYHGSENAGFHEFNTRFSDDSTSFFFANSNTVAKSYSGTREVYAPKTLRTADDLNSFFEEIGASEYAAEERDGTFYLLDDGDEVAESDTASGIYEEFQDWTGIGHGSANYKVYLNITNPLIVDAERNNWNELPAADGKTKTTREYAKEAESKGHDGVIFHNIIDNGAYASGMEQYETSTVAIAFNAEQVKSTENKHPTDDPDIRFSMKDSAGRELSDGQREYFKDSKERDRDGNLRVMYNGGGGDFTVFDRKKSKYSNLYGRGFYFTNSESHAKQYGDARSFYLNIVNPVSTDERTITKKQLRKFLEAVAENEDDYSFENYGYGATVDSVLNSVYGEKSDFAMLYDVSQTAIGDMVAAVELFNEVNGTMYDGLILDTETVIFNSEQAKLTSNENPTSNPDVRFSMKKDRDYLAAVESGDMKTAQKMVDEAAKMVMPNSKIVNDDGTLKKVYHGSANQFNVFDYGRLGNTGHQEGFGFYFADTKTITKHYGESREFYLDMQRPMYSDKKTITLRELMKFMKALDPDGNGVISGYEDAGSVGYTTALRRAASTIMEFNDNDQDVIFEVANADGSNYTADEFIKFAKVLKETIGFDGLISAWPAGNVYVVFDNKQMKFADVVTRDDTGETIPLSDRFNKDTEDLRFSLKGQSSLLDENKKLREVNEALREQFKTTKFAQVDKKQLDAFAKKLLQDYESGADINETRDALNDLYVYMANGEDGQAPVWSEVQRRAYDAAVAILEEAITINDDLYQEYKSLRERLRKHPISINKMYDGDLGGYESINEFRKANFGRIKLTNDGTPVDIVYNDLASTYPEFFDEYHYSTQADQLVHIAEVLDSLQPYEVNPYSYNMREAASWLADDIIERFYELPQAKPTFADKAEQKLTKQVIKDAKKLETLRDKKNERIAKLIEQSREKVRKTQQKERTKRAEAVAKVQEKYKDRIAKGRDARKAKELRERIMKHSADMSKKLLSPTDKSNIPEALRAPVAMLLDAINLESNYTYDPQSGSYKKNDDGLPTSRTRAFEELRKAYKKIMADASSDMVIDPALLGVDADDISSNLDYVIGLRDIRIADMTIEQLDTVWKTLRAIEASITTAGRTFAQQKYETTKAWADAFVADTETRKGKTSVTQQQVSLDLLTPYTFFSRYGQAGKDFYRMLRDAQDRQQVQQDEIAEDVKKLASLETRKKLEKETIEVKTARGEKLTLSKAQAMEIYLLSKRDQAKRHLLGGGIIQPEVGKVRRGTEAILLTEIDLSKITSALSDEERAFADSFRKLTEKLAKWGNEASTAAFGYEKFGDPDYWPIKSAPEQLYQSVEKGANKPRSIQNMGAAKPLNREAVNTLEIGSLFDTFDRHTTEMLTYSSWLLPMMDANRLFNFSFRNEVGMKTNKTMSMLLNKIGGANSAQYWQNLMKDIQNGISGDHDSWYAGIAEKAIGNVKKASVAGNIRVVVQQPTSIMRAAAVLDPDNIGLGVIRGVTEGKGWEKAVKHAPIAARKAAGGFEIGSNSRQLAEQMYLPDTRGGKTKKLFLKDSPFLLAGKADEITWSWIWNASEWQVARTHKELEAGSTEFYKAVTDLFNETIDQTQVVDGILQRSQIMRSSNALARQMTNFMGEPIMTLNVAIRAYETWRYETSSAKRASAKKVLARSVAALLASSITVAFMQSLWDAVRDDDEEKGYWEKVWSAFSGLGGDEETWHEYAKAILLEGNAFNAINPANMIPYVNDVLSVIKGFTVERMDAGAFGDFVSAAKQVIKSFSGDGKWETWYASTKALTTGAKLAGSQAYNLVRDVEAIIRTFTSALGGAEATYELDSAIYNEKSQKSHFIDLLYQLYKEGDMESYRKIAQELVDAGVEPSSIDSGIKSRAKKDGVSTKDMNTATFSAGIDVMSGIKKPEKEKLELDDLSGTQYDKFIADRGQMLDEIISDFQRRGFGSLDEETAENLLDAAYAYAENTALLDAAGASVIYKTVTDANGKESQKQYIQDGALQYESNLPKWVIKAQDADDLGMTVAEYLMLREEYDSDITADGVYDAYAEGVDVDTYLYFKDALGDLEYEKGVSGARKAAVVELLNSMPITQDEWDYLFGTEYKTGSSGFGGSFGGSFGGKFGK